MTSPTGVPFLDTLVASLATEAQELERALGFGSWGTSGPETHPAELEPEALILHPSFVDGWWYDAKRVDCHPDRKGGPIKPFATGLHTTDMLPDEWDALVAAWSSKPGDGACAHFLIGRDEAHGVIQFVPITLNGNHMGGPGHGVFVLTNGTQLHPNLVTNGIEVHCAGGVRMINGVWRLVENNVAHGKPIPPEDVIVDAARPGRGVHKITDYQYAILERLLRDLRAAQYALPAGIKTQAFGEEVPAWAKSDDCRVVTHVRMDPVHRADPWPPGCAWLKDHLP